MHRDNEERNKIELIKKYDKAYEEGNPIVSDKEYDEIYYSLENKPDIINYEVVNSLEKIEHDHPMLSLDKTKDIEEIKAYFGESEVLGMLKLDGLSMSLTYENGKLIRAETRGNGKIGENVLHNAKVISSIPTELSIRSAETAGKIVVDGEVICKYDDFEAFKEDFANPRNFAAGSLRLLDSKECSKRNLTFVVWDCIEGFEYAKTLNDKLILLSILGFHTVPFFRLKGKDLYDKSISFLKDFATRYKYPIDGYVFKFNDCEEYKSKGKTEHHFKGGFALKEYDEEYETYLKDIEWKAGRGDILTPVAIFEPIELEDSTIQRASLHNLGMMENVLGKLPHEGQKIWVSKRNQIIPYIERAEKSNRVKEGRDIIEIPSYCPYCGRPTKIIPNGDVRFLVCDNPSCEGKIINHLEHFCSKKGLDIKGLSKKTLQKLVDWGWLSSIEDIFNLKKYREEWIIKDGFGILSVDKILKAIDDSRTTDLNSFICAIGIPLVGKAIVELLEKNGIDTYEDFRKATLKDLIKIDGIALAIGSNIVGFDYEEADNIYNKYMNIINKRKKEESENPNILKDVTFVITGKLKIFKNRNELSEKIKNAGGKVASAVSGKTHFLINNDSDSNSTKNKKAKELKIPILTEEEFLKKFFDFKEKK